MIQQHSLTDEFRPSFERDYETPNDRVNIQVQYLGPIPTIPKRDQFEIFVYAIYQHGKRIETGSLEWDPSNGPMTTQEVAKALLVHWCTERRLDF